MHTAFALTAADVLRLEILERGHATLVAGAAGTGNVIRWVHSTEVPDIARFLVGGELLLTAGLGMGTTDAEHRAYIRSVADASVAMLCVELSGRAFHELPEAMVREAEAVGLPLVTVTQEIPFVEVAAQVHNSIVDLRIQELTADAAVSSAFIDLLLQGEDAVSMVRELADLLDRPCMLEDQAHQLSAYPHRSDEADAVVAEWQFHSRSNHEGSLACSRFPVVLKGEVWGWLHVLAGDAQLSPPETRVVERAVAAIAIILLSEQLRGARRAQRHTALISRLMLGDINGEGFVKRAIRLGRDLRGKSFLVLAASQEGVQEPFDEGQLNRCLTDCGLTAVVADTGSTTVAVVGLAADTDPTTVLSKLSRLPARVGVSQVVSAAQLPEAVGQATSAHAVAASGDSARRVVRFDDLGMMRLLIVLSDGPELAKYVEDELGTLLAHDAASGNRLLPTLRAFLACDGRKSETAHRLSVQRRTLYYRLDRLNALLQVSMDNPDDRLRLLLAVRGLDLLHQRDLTDHSSLREAPLNSSEGVQGAV